MTFPDIDECALPTGGHICSYRCHNTPGSFHCSCPVNGYTLAVNGRSCQGELSVMSCCSHVAFVGDPFSPALEKKIMLVTFKTLFCLSDIDECVTGSHTCTENQSCFNVQGGFRCLSFECPNNYRRVGET